MACHGSGDRFLQLILRHAFVVYLLGHVISSPGWGFERRYRGVSCFGLPYMRAGHLPPEEKTEPGEGSSGQKGGIKCPQNTDIVDT